MDEQTKKKIENLIRWLRADPQADEDQARRFLADQLRTTRPLDLGLRFALGDLFDPDLAKEQGLCLTIKRGRGNRTNTLDLTTIAQHVWQATQNGEMQKYAIADAAKKFHCHRKTVRTAWKRHRPIFEQYPELGWGSIPPKDWVKTELK